MKNHNFKTGFTLIELIVVIAVFLFVIGAAIGIFISVVHNQKKVLAEQQLLNQISYAQEYMSKALRMAKTSDTVEDAACMPQGYIYLLTQHDTGSGFYRGIKLINQSDNNVCQEFFWDIDGILKEKKGNDSQAVALTSPSLHINSARFAINGSDTYGELGCLDPDECGASDEDFVQPKVTILLNINIPREDTSKTIQTTVSRRNLNVDYGQRQQ